MSLNRQRSYNRMNKRTSSSAIHTPTTETAVQTSYVSSLEEEWVGMSIPGIHHSSHSSYNSSSGSYTTWQPDICRCCNKISCNNFEVLSNTIRKLEEDARLAAEIGQSLLHEHEKTVVESKKIRNDLESQIKDLSVTISELEGILLESDNTKHELIDQNSRSMRELQKTQKTLDETIIDLEISNNRCSQLGAELKERDIEVEKLRVFKFMARQADIREDTLRAKLEDTKQELALSRKTELTLESKHKKLTSKYESMCLAYEKLKLDHEGIGLTSDHHINLVWLREANEKLRKDILKLTSASILPNNAADMQMANQNHFIELIKELASANNKLKLDLLDCSDLLVESRAEVSRLYLKLEELQQTDESHPEELHPLKHLPTHPHLPAKINNYPKQQHQGEWLSSSAPQTTDGLPVLPRIVTSFPVAIKTTMDDTDKKTALSESPESSPVLSSPTIVHHHYHYYLRNKLLSEKRKNDSQRRLSDTPCPDNELYRDCNISAPNVTLSSSTSSRSLSDHRADITSPFSQLRSTVTIALQRLQKTDIRALNRRLKKAFDMLELTSMSNSIIESIVSDLEHLKMQFSWMEDKTLVRDEVWANDISMMEFFPLLHLVQEMLREIGQLRTTMNDLQVEYVKKVEESDIRLEEELLKKERQEIAQRKSNAKTSPFSWITNVFQRSHNSKEVTFNHETSYSVIHSSPSSSNMTSIVTRTKKIEVDRYGPISSFPTRSPAIAIGGEKKRRSMTQTVQSISTTTHMKAYPILRASQSAGTVRRSKSMQPSALDYVVRRKRSTLGLSTTTPVDFDHVISPQPTPPEIAGTFSTSWLGNK